MPPVLCWGAEVKRPRAGDKAPIEATGSPRNAKSTPPPPALIADLGLAVVMYIRVKHTEPTPPTRPTLRNAKHVLQLHGQMDEIYLDFWHAMCQGPLVPVTPPTIVSTVLDRQEIFAKSQKRQLVPEDITTFFLQKEGGSDRATGN